eukprot:scaffold175_cov414-Prasinococcus_capsulatus_cf.AAC.4
MRCWSRLATPLLETRNAKQACLTAVWSPLLREWYVPAWVRFHEGDPCRAYLSPRKLPSSATYRHQVPPTRSSAGPVVFLRPTCTGAVAGFPHAHVSRSACVHVRPLAGCYIPFPPRNRPEQS